MRRVLACLAAASAFLFAAPVPDASAAGRGSSYGRAGFAHRPALRHPGFNRLALRRDRFGYGARFGRGRFGHGSRFAYGYPGFGYGYGHGRGDVQQNVFVGGEDAGGQRFDRFPITATTGIAPSPTPEPVIYVIDAPGPDRRDRSVRSARSGAKVVHVGAQEVTRLPAGGARVIAVTVPRAR